MQKSFFLKIALSGLLVFGMLPMTAFAEDDVTASTEDRASISEPSEIAISNDSDDATADSTDETDSNPAPEQSSEDETVGDSSASESPSLEINQGVEPTDGSNKGGVPVDDEAQGSEPVDNPPAESVPSVTYRAHVASVGWQKDVADGALAGTTGRSLSVEALVINLAGVDGTLQYQAHVSNVGWQKPVSTGATAGTTGRSLPVEALRISLDGKVSELYDIYYQVHSANLGWLGWARNGEAAGSAGLSLGVEAIRIKLISKGEDFPEYGVAAFKERMITYQAHVANVGWCPLTSDGAVAGTTGRSLGLEALSVVNSSTEVGGAVVAQGYVQRSGWQPEVRNGAIGTTGRSLSLQAVRFNLDGALAQAYDLYYRVHVSNVGWMGWAKNGAKAGTIGYDFNIEAVEITLVSKGGAAPGKTEDAYRSQGLHYQAHVSNSGWHAPVTGKAIAGTTGKSRALEALTVSLGDQEYEGSIVYQAHVATIGWQNAAKDGAMAGTTGKRLAIQAVRVKLEGEIAKYYDVYYRMHVASIGWLDWALNDAVAGTTACSLQAEAVQIVLVEKGQAAPGPTSAPSRTLAYSYSANVGGLGWQQAATGGATSGTTGRGVPIQQLTLSAKGSTFSGGLQCSAHSANVGWRDYVADGATAGVQGQQLEAVRIRLTGELAQYFDVFYRAHVAKIGWMGWTKNGASAGSSNLGYGLEALQVVILPKGSSAPGSTVRPYRDIAYTNKVPCIYQHPELPTGCESVALTIVLTSMGYNLAKTEIADFYLPRSPWDYVNAFAGNPYLTGGSYNMALPPAIVTAANRYLSAKGASARAHNLRGASFESLYSHIDQGYPVLVWSTVYMRSPIFHGGSLYGYSWYNNEHCVVMYGYDRSANKVLISDPLSGIVWRDASAFKSLYQRCGSLAVVIK